MNAKRRKFTVEDAPLCQGIAYQDSENIIGGVLRRVKITGVSPNSSPMGVLIDHVAYLLCEDIVIDAEKAEHAMYSANCGHVRVSG